jgi:hypothetical protein
MSEGLLLATLVLSVLALLLGYGLADLWVWTPFLALPVVAWLIGLWRRWAWLTSIGFVLCAGAAAAGLLLGVEAGWMLLALVMALAAWDLDSFVRRMEGAEQVEGRQDLERRHLLRLVAVEGVGVLLAAVALGVRLDIGFGAVLLLSLVAVVGLSRVVAFFRRQVS